MAKREKRKKLFMDMKITEMKELFDMLENANKNMENSKDSKYVCNIYDKICRLGGDLYELYNS